MSGLLYVPGLGRATTCTAYGDHRPRPLRFIWHHLLPESAGGATDEVNLVQLCDSCHYAIHALLFYLAQHGGQFPAKSIAGDVGKRGDYAAAGYQLAVAAGTVDKIPNEGSILTMSGWTQP